METHPVGFHHTVKVTPDLGHIQRGFCLGDAYLHPRVITYGADLSGSCLGLDFIYVIAQKAVRIGGPDRDGRHLNSLSVYGYADSRNRLALYAEPLAAESESVQVEKWFSFRTFRNKVDCVLA